MPSVLFLHTAPVHERTFRDLLAAAAPEAEQRHVVREDWLARAQAGLGDDLRAEIAAFLTEAAGAHDAVLCTCSTLGPLAETTRAEAPNVFRIDRPLAEQAASHDGPILVAFCLESTRAPTLDILRTVHHEQGKEPDLIEVFCANAWPRFEIGDTDGFACSIAATVAAAAEKTHPACIVLAQASMAVAAPFLAALGVPVYSSPSLAITAVVEQLR